MITMTEQVAEGSERIERQEPKFKAQTYLERALPRQPGDTLKVVPMPSRDAFRVNWYHRRASLATIPGLNTVYIRDSKFLFCRLDAAGKPEITYPATQLARRPLCPRIS